MDLRKLIDNWKVQQRTNIVAKVHGLLNCQSSLSVNNRIGLNGYDLVKHLEKYNPILSHLQQKRPRKKNNLEIILSL